MFIKGAIWVFLSDHSLHFIYSICINLNKKYSILLSIYILSIYLLYFIYLSTIYLSSFALYMIFTEIFVCMWKGLKLFLIFLSLHQLPNVYTLATRFEFKVYSVQRRSLQCVYCIHPCYMMILVPCLHTYHYTGFSE